MPGTRIAIFGWADSVHVGRWARGLSERGYHIKVISPYGQPIDGIETVNFATTETYSYLRLAPRAAAEAARFNPHITHVHSCGGPGLWGLWANRQPMVVSVWGTDVVTLPRKLYYRIPIKRVLRKAMRISATSEYLKAVAARLLPGIDDKIEVIPFGVGLPDDDDVLPPPDPLMICYVKMLLPTYGPDVLIRAVAIVKQTTPRVILNMAGLGKMEDTLKSMIVALGLERNVNLVGFVDNSRINSFIRKHHLMAMPSRGEAFGVAALDASACGRPVVATSVGGVPEVVADGKTGILVPPDDPESLARAILRLAGDPDLRAAMGRAGREFVRQYYTWERSLDLMSALYDGLLEKPA